jgi:fatty-acid desaturase
MLGRCTMRIIPDIIIATGIIVSVVAFWGGYRWVGGIAGFIALIVGWKRDWCMESVTHLWGSSGDDSSTSEDAGDVGDSGGADRD